MHDPPGRKPGPARESVRWSFVGHGTPTRVEKDRVGLFLDDVAYAFADVSFSGMPVLLLVALTVPVASGGVKGAAFLAWMAMVVGAALVRGGWVQPPFTTVPGWVSLAPVLLVLRVLYFNVALALAAYGGWLLGEALPVPLVRLGWALLVGVVAVAVFPALAGAVARWRARG